MHHAVCMFVRCRLQGGRWLPPSCTMVHGTASNSGCSGPGQSCMAQHTIRSVSSFNQGGRSAQQRLAILTGGLQAPIAGELKSRHCSC